MLDAARSARVNSSVSLLHEAKVMKPNNWVNLIRLCALGALNGLLFGVAIEMLRVWHAGIEIERYEAQERANPGGLILCFSEPSFNVGIPLLCAVVFAGACHLVHRYYKNRPQSVLLLWQAVGFVAATGCAILDFANTPMLGYYRFSEAIWRWVVCFAVVIPINFIYSLIVESSVLFYTQGHDD